MKSNNTFLATVAIANGCYWVMSQSSRWMNNIRR